jgi:hypothetical protein
MELRPPVRAVPYPARLRCGPPDTLLGHAYVVFTGLTKSAASGHAVIILKCGQIILDGAVSFASPPPAVIPVDRRYGQLRRRTQAGHDRARLG